MKKNLIILLSLILSISIKAQISFDDQDTLSTQRYNARKVLAADIDGDGIKDIIAGSSGKSGEVGKWGTIVYYKNDGNANFQTADTIANYVNCIDLAVGDLNNDGSKDFVYFTGEYMQLIWYSNDSTGNFTKQDTIKQYSLSAGFVSTAICDMDKDGDMDVVCSYYSADTISWFENNTIGGGDTAWTEHVIADNYDGSDIVPVDIDADGDIDIITVSPGNWLVTWFENNGSGAWTEHEIDHPTEYTPNTLFVSDLDKDNDLDILVGFAERNDSARVSWYANLGSGNFGSENEIYAIQKGGFSNYKQFNDVLTADLDLDGDEDIIAASDDDKIVSIENLGNGTFSTARQITTEANNPVSIFVADLDGTTDIDLLSASKDDNKIAFYDNITPIILQNPQDANPVCVGTDSVLFTVSALNADSYHWKENDLNSSDLSDNTRYHGTTTDSLYVDADYTIMNGYQYVCVVKNKKYDKDTSEFATLTVDQKIIADAGNDRSFCDTNRVELDGNNPSPHVGTWTSSVGTASFNNETVFNTMAQNFGTGIIEMYWTIDNKSCGMSTDTMIIKNYQHIIASVGTDDEICDTTKYQLQGSSYSSPSWAKWYVNRSEVTFDDDSSPTAIASNIPAGNTTFTWYIYNSSCGSTSDDMIISRYETIIADAGDDVVICDQTVASIHANNPSPASGYWTASNATVIIADSNYHDTNLSNIPHGSTTFTWTIVNHACGSNSDEMILSSYNYVNIDEQPTDLTVEEGEKANLKLKVSGDVASYQWYKNDNILNNDSRITGTTTDSLIIDNSMQSDTGSYKCVFIDYCNQNEHSSNVAYLTVNASSTGIKDIEKAGISIYPNPSNGQFQIINTGNSINKISIINMQGKIIYELDKAENNPLFIDLTAYPKGIYMLNIDKNKQNLKYRIIIQ